MTRRMIAPREDDLGALFGRLRALGGKVSSNVVDGYNITHPDGREIRTAGSRYAGPSRDRLKGKIHEWVEAYGTTGTDTPHLIFADYEYGDESTAIHSIRCWRGHAFQAPEHTDRDV